MSFNTDGNGDAICTIITDKKLKNKKNPVIYLDDEEDKGGISSFKEINKEHLKDAKLEIYPNTNKERDVLFITGKSGSGKSYFARNYCIQYHKLFKDNKMFLFSTCLQDPAFDDLDYIKRYELDDDFLKDEFVIGDFENMLIVFDDFDTIQNKDIKEKVKFLLDMILTTGRKTNTTALITSHLPCNGKETKLPLYESTSVTFFVKGLGGKTLNYLLEQYLGLDKEQIKKIKKLKSRAVTVLKTYPQCILAEQDLFLL
jgi:hypothetical protein